MKDENINVLFEDENLAVVLKNAGLNSQDFFKPAFKQKNYAQAVNRLDKPVTGVVLIAFNKKVHTKLNDLFKNQAVKKEYWAIVKKTDKFNFDKNNITRLFCENYLTFNSKLQKAFIKCNDNTCLAKNNSKKAAMYWEIIGSGNTYNFVRIFPLTGRTHQIRVQLSNLDMPIKGDIKYGARRSEKTGGIRLHAYSISFEHPCTKKNITLFSFPPLIDSLWSAFIEQYNKI